jgi:MFS family permease
MFGETKSHDPTRGTVLLLYGIIVCRSMAFLVPVVVPYFAREIGLSFQEFLASESIFAVTVVIMEVPSGWLADVWQRKGAIVLGGLFSAVGVALFIPADSFADAALANCLMGIGISLFSGADAALLYDALQQHGRENRYRVIEGRRHSFGLYAVALSSLAGA